MFVGVWFKWEIDECFESEARILSSFCWERVSDYEQEWVDVDHFAIVGYYACHD